MTLLRKIARLPREIREELNVRLQNGEVGRLLVDWLNGLPAALAVLKERFEGRPITDGNLSEWKQGGYEDWVRHQENCALACLMTEMSGDLEKEAGESRLEERLVASLVMALARELREAEELADGAERLKRILEIGRQLSQIRRKSHQAERVRIEQERWAEKESKICQRQHAEAEKAARSEAIWERTKAQFPALRPFDELEAELREIELVEERAGERRLLSRLRFMGRGSLARSVSNLKNFVLHPFRSFEVRSMNNRSEFSSLDGEFLTIRI